MQATTSFLGTVFRCIPSSSTTPLSSSYSVTYGGRWNASGTYPVLYTFLSQNLAATWYYNTLTSAGLTINEVQPEQLPDLIVLNCDLSNVADLTTDEGLSEVGLPAEYPEGFRGQEAWVTTQPIGATVYHSGHTSILTRSASAPSWEGSMVNWAELAIFADHAPEPELVDRINHEDWL